MKTLILNSFLVEETQMHEQELFKAAVNYVNQQAGITIEEQEKRLRLLAALRSCTKEAEVMTVSLEDADVDLIKNLVHSMKWASVNENIVSFGKKVKEL